METFISQIPTTPIGWLTLFLVSISASVYLGSRIRKNDMEILRSTNKDQYDRIILLETSVERLSKCVIELQSKNKTLEDLVVVALKEYYFEHPTIAVDIKGAIGVNKEQL
jgi:hypothetical protein